MTYVATFEKVATLDSARVIHWTLAGTDGREVSGQYLEDFFKNLGDKVVYVQDLSRDGPFLADYALKNNLNASKDYVIDCDRKFFCIKVGKALILNLKRIFNFTVSELSEKLGLPNDEKTVALALARKLDSDGIKHPMSAASAAIYAWSSTKSGAWWNAHKEETKEKDPDIERDIVESYRGGLCIFNSQYKCKEVLANGYDVNSLYPSIMLTLPMPFGQGKKVQTSESITSLHVVHIVATIKEGRYPFIPNPANLDKYVYPKEISGIFYLWKDEFDLARLCYEGTFSEICAYEFGQKKGLFTEYVTKWYNAKKTASNKVDRAYAKMMLNSLYGKFGQRSELINSVAQVRGNQVTYVPVRMKARTYDAKIASFIASEGRVKLLQAIQMNYDRFIYADTDSVVLEGSGEPTGLLLDDSKLGYFKHDKINVMFKALGQKTYITTKDGETSFTIAGVVKEVSKTLTKDDFKPGAIIKGARMNTVVVNGGIRLIPETYTLPF